MQNESNANGTNDWEEIMAFCGKCGNEAADGVAFCPKCGAPIDAGTPVVAANGAGTAGMQENVASMLCYVLGWLTGIIFLLVDKRPTVRFHAAQSIVVFGALFLCRMVLTFGIIGSGFYSAFAMFSLWSMISMLLSLVTLAAWLILMITAYQGKRFEVPVAAGIAKSIAGNQSI